jgi:hypothetical protein
MLPTSKLWAIALLIAVAGAGFALGALTTDWTHRQPPAREARGREGYSAYLATQLELDSVQRDSVRAILQRYRPAMRAVFDQVRPQMDSVRRQMQADIHNLLTPARERAMRERAAQGSR